MESSSLVLNPLDLILAGIIIFGMYRGATKGFFPMSNRVLSIGIGIIMALNLRYLAQSLYLDYLNVRLEPQVVALLSFATAFVVVYIVFSAILGFLTNALAKMKIKLDSALGALFGGLVATLLLSIAMIIFANFNFPTAQHRSDSILYGPVRNFSGYTLEVGQGALRKANQQINRIGVGQPEGNPEPTVQQPLSTRPGAVR